MDYGISNVMDQNRNPQACHHFHPYLYTHHHNHHHQLTRERESVVASHLYFDVVVDGGRHEVDLDVTVSSTPHSGATEAVLHAPDLPDAIASLEFVRQLAHQLWGFADHRRARDVQNPENGRGGGGGGGGEADVSYAPWIYALFLTISYNIAIPTSIGLNNIRSINGSSESQSNNSDNHIANHHHHQLQTVPPPLFIPPDVAAVVVGGFALDAVLRLDRHGPRPQALRPLHELVHDSVQGGLRPYGVGVVDVDGRGLVGLPFFW